MRAFLAIIFFFITYNASIVAFANTTVNPSISTPVHRPNYKAEKWILEQIYTGKVANLKETFPNEADRVISAKFLENLLTNSKNIEKVPRKKIRIKNAIVFEPLDLEDAVIPYMTWLNDCHFENTVNLLRSNFLRHLSFEGCSFKEATFEAIKVDSYANFEKSVFTGSVNFESAEIASSLEADEAQFNNAEKGVTFNSMKVGDAAFFNKAIFAGPVNFGHVEIVSNLEADEATFNNAKKGANFKSMKVGSKSLFRNVIFTGTIDLSDANFLDLLISGFSDFYEYEFVTPLTIERLCKIINDDNYNVTLEATINTIGWLNELLIVSDFYDILHIKKPNSCFSKNITDLVDKTKEYRNKSFSDLNTDEQINIKRLNRLLLEETYPQQTPKSLIRGPAEKNNSTVISINISRAIVKRELKIEGLNLNRLSENVVINRGKRQRKLC